MTLLLDNMPVKKVFDRYRTQIGFFYCPDLAVECRSNTFVALNNIFHPIIRPSLVSMWFAVLFLSHVSLCLGGVHGSNPYYRNSYHWANSKRVNLGNKTTL